MCRKVLASTLHEFQKEVEAKRRAALGRVNRIPVAALIWGPAPDSGSTISVARVGLKNALIENGHIADFSEDLYDKDSPHSNLIQQATQAEAYDIFFLFRTLQVQLQKYTTLPVYRIYRIKSLLF